MLEQLMALAYSTIESNEFLQGGFILGLLGTIAVWARRLPALVWSTLKRALIVECDVQQKDDTFLALLEWLANHPYGKRVKRFSAVIQEKEVAEGFRQQVMLSPAPGTHLLWYKNNLIRIHRGREKMKSDDFFSGFYESITLQTFGRQRAIIVDLLDEALALRAAKNNKVTIVYTLDGYNSWRETARHTIRPLNSLVLANGVKEGLIQDLGNFLKSREWYASLGIPYRRGYLFQGPPGTGKSSACLVLAGHFGLNVVIVSMSDKNMTDTKLVTSLGQAPKSAILLIEDVDCLYHEDRTAKEAVGATLSGLLNVLDGAVAQEGRIVIMTTNHPELLDRALTRPGRADMCVEFGLATMEQATEMFFRFFPEADELRAKEFAERFGDGKVSTAELQTALMSSMREELTLTDAPETERD